MQLVELLQELRQRGMSVARQGDQLKIAAPPDSLTAGLREKILQHKPSLLQWLREQEQAGQAALPACVPDPAGLYQPFPLADLQLGFFMADSPDMEFHVRPHYYNEFDRAGLDVERYQRAWNKALRRHHGGLVALTADHALQTLNDPAPLRCAVQDLRGHTPAEVAAALAETRAGMMRSELPLDRWPWIDLRVSLWREDDQVSGQELARVHYNHNNFFSDGYGTVKLLREVELYYREPELSLPPLSLSYRDAVLALDELARSGQGQAAQRYWEERLPLMPEPPPLPLRASLDRRCRSRLRRREGFLPAADWTAFKANAARCGVTPSNAIFTAYAEVLSAWSNSRHFVLSNMMTRRLDLHPEMRAIIGNFASLYPLEIDLRGAGAFSDRARRIQEQVARDALHLQWGGMRVMQAWNRRRGAPLGAAAIPFVVGSGLFMEDFHKPDFGCLETSQVMLDHQFNQLHDGRYYYMWDVLEEFFLPGVLDQMQAAYEGLLRRLAAEPAAWNAATPDLAPVAQLAARAAATPPAVPVSRLRLDDFLRAAAAMPDAAALRDNGSTLGYAELLAGASGVAQRLRQVCPAPAGRNVVVACERGATLLCAVHGVLLAGAAYVPLDPGLPPERLRYIVQDSGAAAVLVQRRYRDCFDASCPVLAIEDIAPAAPPPNAGGPDDLAYLIYTSGSTGKPKGVMIDHQGAVNTILDINRRYAVSRADRLFGISSFGFDLSVYDLFGAAAAGAALVYPGPEQALDPSHWLDLMLAQGVTIWNSAPPLAVLLVESAAARGVLLPALRLVMLSGDWIPVDLPDKLRSCAPHARVVSLGGATEASIWSILYDIDAVDPAWSSIPYGYPMTNQPWRILGEWGQPVPDWVTGELYIGGAGLARGYWNNPRQSSAAFVTVGSERLYRTGDIGRYQPGGLIEFLGRRDQQVKIAGHRIELGEIEAVLAAEPEVNSAVVVLRGGHGAHAHLEAYVTASGGARPESERLKRVLASKLPAYMVPRAVQVLERLPLNANGKVDRNALPALPPATAANRVRRAPRDHWETGVLEIWRSALGQPELGVTDDFFDAGGQSFEAVRIIGAIRESFGQSVSLGAIWREPTVEGVAAVLRAGGHATATATLTLTGPAPTPVSALLPLRADGGGTPLYLAHPAGGQVVRYRQLAGLLRRPVHGFQAADPALAGSGIQALAAAYVAELEACQPAGALVLGGWSSGAVIAFEMAAQLLARGREVQGLVLLDCPAPRAQAPAAQRTLLAWFLEDCALGLPVAALMAQLPALPPEPQAQMELAAAQLQAMGHGLPVKAAQLTAFYRVFCAVVQATRSYQPRPLPLDVLLLRARDGAVSEFTSHPCHGEEDWGWRALCKRLALVHVPGDHHGLLGGESAPLLGMEIEAWLAKNH